MSSPDPTCRHPKAYVANAALWDVSFTEKFNPNGTGDPYQLMMGCVLCSQWQEAPITWQIGGDALNIGHHETA